MVCFSTTADDLCSIVITVTKQGSHYYMVVAIVEDHPFSKATISIPRKSLYRKGPLFTYSGPPCAATLWELAA